MNNDFPPIRLHNTLSRTLEPFKPVEPGKIRMYHCGPTVYWTQHIGNLRGMTMGDLVVRTLRYFGYAVNHVRNYTDVGHLTSDSDTGEDKMEKGVRREGTSPKQIADKYIAQFERDTQALNLLEPTHKPRATEYVPQMIQMVETLLEKGFAYETDLAVYFDVRKFPHYTELSGQDMEKIAEGAGKADVSDERKKYPADFALWFFRAGTHAHALQYWPSPFHSALVEKGQGFPGWHLECSVMSKSLLGETLDVHMGGVEHIPVHHTNEIAQSEAANGVQFVHYWLHNEHLAANREKMAKSQGTGFSLDEVTAKGFEPAALRYFFLGAQYRSKQNFTWEALAAAAKGLEELRKKYLDVRNAPVPAALSGAARARQQQFRQALANDVNVPQALAVAWDALKSNMDDGEKHALVKEFDAVLGLRLDAYEERILTIEDLPESVRSLASERRSARLAKRFAQADAARRKIEQAGFTIEDTPDGPRFKKR